MSRVSFSTLKIKQAVLALLVCTIVIGVPVFSLVNIGYFFLGGPKRCAEPLSALSLRPADQVAGSPRLFEEPLISVTFDDGHETTYSTAMPLLQKYGIKTTQYVLSGTADNPAYVSWDQITQMQKAGHEIACHSFDHPNLTILDSKQLEEQVSGCKKELTKRYGPIHNFASPYGAANAETIRTISKNFASHRNTVGDPTNGVNELDANLASNFNRYNIIGFTARNDTTVAQLRALVEYAKARNGWVVLTYHQADDSTSEYSVTSEDFNRQFGYLASTDVRIVTMQEALGNYQTKKGRQ